MSTSYEIDIMTPEEVAEQLKVRKETVYRWVKSGQLPATHIGRQIRFRPEDVAKFVGLSPEMTEGTTETQPAEQYDTQKHLSEPTKVRFSRYQLIDAFIDLIVDEVVERLQKPVKLDWE